MNQACSIFSSQFKLFSTELYTWLKFLFNNRFIFATINKSNVGLAEASNHFLYILFQDEFLE